MRSQRTGKKAAGFVGLAAVVVLVVSPWFFHDWLRGWYHLYREFERLPDNAQSYAEYRHKKTGIVFVRLPGGRFWMGSRTEEESGPDEWPRHQVVLKPFLIAKYEVRQSEWQRPLPVLRFTGDDLPVTQVSWEACQSFCEDAGLKLPTEAQWEYACRAGSTGAFGGTGALNDMGWHHANARSGPRGVGFKKPNAFGLHDMHGNVWELCRDVYNSGFYSRPDAVERDPVCTTIWVSEIRVRRGGSWRSSASGCRSGFRSSAEPTQSHFTVGFRPVWTLW